MINLNDLANAMKPIVLPGEGLTVKLIKRGEEPGQGVGYLDDGTMVVTEQGAYHLGETVRLTVTSVLQTSAGRMIFGRIDADPRRRPRTRRAAGRHAGPAPAPGRPHTRSHGATARPGERSPRSPAVAQPVRRRPRRPASRRRRRASCTSGRRGPAPQSGQSRATSGCERAW